MTAISREKIALVVFVLLVLVGIGSLVAYLSVGHNWNVTASQIDDATESSRGTRPFSTQVRRSKRPKTKIRTRRAALPPSRADRHRSTAAGKARRMWMKAHLHRMPLKERRPFLRVANPLPNPLRQQRAVARSRLRMRRRAQRTFQQKLLPSLRQARRTAQQTRPSPALHPHRRLPAVRWAAERLCSTRRAR